ncbi:MAG: phytase esterase-like protein [Oceanospirillaceae bacterium]|nr:phytase esterase-like protein [Oceanospirillaceae bacterium]|tara:strand:- start:130 stop:1545 length:1416 start_codon:yes stop_codon:yes gene_type:complete
MLKKALAVALTTTGLMLAGCGSDDDSHHNELAFLDNFPADGTLLDYQILRADLIDGKTQQTFEIRNGGYGSAMTAHPSHKNWFYALTDRGPNATYTGDQGKGKKFPVADYTPRIGLFQVNTDGSITQLDTILLKDRQGNAITGLPNTSALGGTGETPYDADGKVIPQDDSLPYNATTNPIRLDDYGLDGEGLAAMDDGTFWISDEYGPHIVHFSAEGVELDRINAFADDDRVNFHLPAEFANRRANRGMEGLAVTPDQQYLVGVMQSTMYNPDSAVKDLDITRIVKISLQDGSVSQYLYKQEKNQNSNSELVALSGTEFLLLERDGSFLYGGPKAADPDAQKQVYRIDLSDATDLESVADSGTLAQDSELGLTIAGETLEEVVLNQGWSALTDAGITPVSKALVVDMVSVVNYPHDKMEGLWVIDDSHLGVLNDDDFATWSTGGELEQKMLDSNTIDGNRLYIVEADLSTD